MRACDWDAVKALRPSWTLALADVEVPPVPVGQMVSLSTRVLLGSITVPGSYYVWVLVDNDFARSVLVTVPPPE